jgi:hypothetical protein
MAKACVKFEKAKAVCFFHNDRSAKDPDYLIGSDDEYQNECNRPGKEAQELLEQLTQEAKINYKKHTGQRLQSKNFHWEAVVTLNRHHTLKDVKKLAAALEQEYGFTAVQIAVHKDEGHINDKGIKQYNNHAHINFFTLDKKTGHQLMNLRAKKNKHGDVRIERTNLSKMQDMAAEILNMERGEIGSKKIAMNHKEYRQYAKEIDALKLQIKQAQDENAELEARNKLLEMENKYYTKKIESEKPTIIDKNADATAAHDERYKTITYKNKPLGQIFNNGNELTTNIRSDKAAAFNLMQEAKELGWNNLKISGRDDFVLECYKYALNHNEFNQDNPIKLEIKDKHQQELCKDFYNEYLKGKNTPKIEQLHPEPTPTITNDEKTPENANLELSGGKDEYRERLKELEEKLRQDYADERAEMKGIATQKQYQMLKLIHQKELEQLKLKQDIDRQKIVNDLFYSLDTDEELEALSEINNRSGRYGRTSERGGIIKMPSKIKNNTPKSNENKKDDELDEKYRNNQKTPNLSL